MKKLPRTLSFTLLLWGVTLPLRAAELEAVVAWSQRVELGMPVSGVVSEVLVQPGRPVKKGDRLVGLDDRGFSSEVGRWLAEHRYAKAALEEAEREDARAVELYDRTVLSDFERNQALIALQSARARAAQAQARLVQARLDLERSVLRAPFDGVVLAVNAAPGQSVISALQSQPLVTLADNRRYHARAQVDAAQAARLAPGSTLGATLRGQPLEVTVAHVGFEPIGPAGQAPRYELVVEIVAGGQPLRVGETLMLHLE